MSLATRSNTSELIANVEASEKLCQGLLKTKHYAKIGEVGVYAIVHKAMSLGIDPIEALNGGLYFVQGKVEMSGILMARLIRQHKHSITLDRQSNDTICILHGKRADNGDTWKTSFSIDDAKRAGLLSSSSSPWTKYPDIMCYNRALSKLARQLFPDVIGNCYIEGEIEAEKQVEVIDTNGQVLGADEAKQPETVVFTSETITPEQAIELDTLIGDDEPFRITVMDFLDKRFKAKELVEIPTNAYQAIYNKVSLHAQVA